MNQFVDFFFREIFDFRIYTHLPLSENGWVVLKFTMRKAISLKIKKRGKAVNLLAPDLSGVLFAIFGAVTAL